MSPAMRTHGPCVVCGQPIQSGCRGHDLWEYGRDVAVWFAPVRRRVIRRG